MLNEITRIDGKGFMAFKESFCLVVEDYVGKTVQIDGLNKDDEFSQSNGSGKSTLLETFYWGLYGKLCRRNKYQDEVINKQSNTANLAVDFKKEDNLFQVFRSVERKKSPSLKLYRNGDELLKGSTYQIKQTYLEKILGMDSLSFQCSVMYGQGFMSFPDLKPSERAKVLTELRGLDRYTEASIKSGDTAKQVGLNIQILADKLKIEEGRLQGVRTVNYKAESEEFEKTRDKAIACWTVDIQDKEKEKDESQNKIQVELTTIQQRMEIAQNELKPLLNMSEKRKLLEETWYAQQRLLSQTISNRDTIVIQMSKIGSEVTKLNKNGEGPCPFCSQTISGEYLQSRVNQLSLEKMELSNEEVTLNEQVKSYQDNVKLARQDVDQIKKDEEEVNKIKSKLESFKIQIKGKKELFDETIKSINEGIKVYHILIEKKRNEANPFIEKENERKENIKKIGVVIRGLTTEVEQLEKEKQFYDIWTVGFKKIRMMLFETMIENLETLIQSFLSRYSSELSVVLTTERETRSGTIKDEFHIGIVDSDGIELSYEMYSGGEKQKIRLSIARALAQFIKDDCGVEFNIMDFDEPNESLDDAGKETNFETFQELSEKENKAVFVTDHDANFKDRFSTTITVVRENKESTIQYG